MADKKTQDSGTVKKPASQTPLGKDQGVVGGAAGSIIEPKKK